jgi:hypothetical protein
LQIFGGSLRGEDDVYSGNRFALIELPEEVERALIAA